MNKMSNVTPGGGGKQFRGLVSPFKFYSHTKVFRYILTKILHKPNALPAFTLAEVLITLAIIGVVAAMTIPSVLNHYREQEVVSKVKKFYSTFSSAIQLAIHENGSIDIWDLAPKSGTYDATSATKFVDYLRPYLKIMTDCGTNSSNECLDSSYYVLLSGSKWPIKYGTSSTYYKFILADGSLVWLRTNGNGCTKADENVGLENICAQIWFDINGNQTKPNQIGKDTFLVYITSLGLSFSSEDNCYLNSTGWSCVNHVMQYGNLNYPSTQ